MNLPVKAVILARGLGTRMRAESFEANLDLRQKKIAEQGIKTLMPIADGKCLLDFIFDSLQSAGFEEICLVIGAEHQSIKDFCRRKSQKISFALQEKPLGTANAVLAAEEFAGGELFLTVNSDNLYPVADLKKLREGNQSGLIGFESASLSAKSNIPTERVANFAVVETDAEGFLKNITEKPEAVANDALVSMNAWVFSPKIFRACRAIEPSVRGEFELADAVMFAVTNLGEKFAVVRSNKGVLDLSNRADVQTIASKIKKIEIG